MKADLFILCSLACIAALFLYVFIGGLVVRLWNACPFLTEKIEEEHQRGMVAIVWPLALWMLSVLCVAQLLRLAYRLSQWRPRRKSTLPGARVVRK